MQIVAKNLSKIYRERKVVDDVSLYVKQGEVVGLLGPNGAGKTTTFYMIVGLEKPTTGEVYIGTENVTAKPLYLRAKMGVSYLAQEASIFRKLSVEENILAILETLEMKRETRKEELNLLLQEFNLVHVKKSKGTELSGGERRRVEIARALALKPKFILLDEPFAGVDPIAVADIQSMITHLKEKNLGILITDHNVRETLSIVDRAYILNNGKLLMEGTSKEVASSEIARKFYLGEKFTL